MILEDNGYDPKKGVLASQKCRARQDLRDDRPDGIADRARRTGYPARRRRAAALPADRGRFTFKFDPAKPQERLKFNNLLPYVESTRAALKYMVEWKNFEKPCIMHQDDEYGKNVLDGFNQQLTAMKLQPASITSYKRGASDFSAQSPR